MPTFLEIAKKIDFESVLFAVFSNEEIKRRIVFLITKRLYEKGTDKENQKLTTDKGNPFYSNYTVKLKKQKRQKFQNVTLRDSGTFYQSFKVDVMKTFFEIQAEFMKENGHMQKNFTKSYNSEAIFEEMITGLTEIEIQILVNSLLPSIIRELKKQI